MAYRGEQLQKINVSAYLKSIKSFISSSGTEKKENSFLIGPSFFPESDSDDTDSLDDRKKSKSRTAKKDRDESSKPLLADF